MIQVAHDAIAHYLGKGLSKDVAVGIAAVLYAESLLKPGSQGAQTTETPGALNPSGAYGIASWNGPRQKALADFASHYSRDPADINTQLDFVLTEAANSYPKFWAAIISPASHYLDVIEVMVETYEIPADKPAEIARATTYAKDFIGYDFAPVAAPAPAPAPAPIAPAPVPAPAPVLSTSVVLDKATLAFVMKLLTTLQGD